ncbi:maleylpyruvate isomerase N-terminal domain-containing protein [Occultella aeris]|uniref:Mycothiol-dependent maleylpyruvate isomerase metal-binding domain-containing protein n=1 Tax=Occultella aeris TaxID=2761496 RepID=A0A7M4DRF2_9MICO|nr:maleylpyruvate isomerase family mycothiol-dependent enzyme [Occultella aeris]VZO40046.1 hypothetical protein HALOF300_04747 [Occultella aeris]
MSNLSAERSRQALTEHTRRLAEAAGAAEPDAPVPTCPGWTVADLVAHVGQTQHWVADIVEHRIADPSQLPTEMAEVPTDASAWPAWLVDGGARVVAAFDDAALVEPVFNAAGDDRTGGVFWLQSQLNEAVIHGYDAAAAAVGDIAVDFDIDADVAAELITNHLAMLTSPTWAALRPESAMAVGGAGESLHWHADDLDASGEWLIERGTDGATWQPGHGTADATVRGPAGVLLLILTRRLPLSAVSPDVVRLDGDAELVGHWVANTAHIAD